MTIKKSNQTTKLIMVLASSLACTTVIIGAFGAHALQKKITVELLDSLETANKYGMYGALFSILILLIPLLKAQSKNRISSILLLGSALFSLSIYILVLLKHKGIDYPKWIAFITPLGGTLLIISFILLIINLLRNHENKQ